MNACEYPRTIPHFRSRTIFPHRMNNLRLPHRCSCWLRVHGMAARARVRPGVVVSEWGVLFVVLDDDVW